MKKLPIGVQTFSEIIEENYLYIDKTKEIHRLFAYGGKYYFLSRPRRFGKSLLVSTLREIFSGNRELFKNLWIYDKIDWKPYPVIHIDFSKVSYKTPEILEKSLVKMVDKFCLEHNVSLTPGGDSKDRFGELIEEVSKKDKVVILIDEYDKPIIDFVDKPETALKNRDILRDFYGVIKGSDEYIKFAFLTGVSKFSRVSVFSGLNNLNDITVDDQFSTLLGYTHEELEYYFKDRIGVLCKKMMMAEDELVGYLERWYNGYSWDGSNFVYNPFSILNLFSKGRFGNYWFASGTPTFLIKLIKKQNKDVAKLEREEVDDSAFESFEIENLEIVSLLFQTGYLTIKEAVPVGVKFKYVLSYPNQEVRESLLKHFLADYTVDGAGTVGQKMMDLAAFIESGDLEEFFSVIQSIFAGIPAPIFIKEREAYYHTVIYLILTLLGVHIEAEVYTNKGRIDAVVKTGKTIYVMEFKMGTSNDALSQVEAMGYHEKYTALGKGIVLLGIGFNESERNIADYQSKEL